MNIEKLKKLHDKLSKSDKEFQNLFEEALEVVQNTAHSAHENASKWDEALEEYFEDVKWDTPAYKLLQEELENAGLDEDPARPYYWLPSDYACL